MRDDREERRQKDLRDLEFYRQRIKPSATELWRTFERPRKGREETLVRCERRRRGDGRPDQLTTPSSIADVQTAMPRRSNRWASVGPAVRIAANRSEGDAIWPLIAALMVLVVLALTNNVDKVATVVPF
jgi:hypothetical protein